MIKWFKIFGSQYIGFWILGLALFALQEIPYMVMPLFNLKSNPIMNMAESSGALNFCEKTLGSLCVAMMIFLVSERATFFDAGSGIRKVRFFATIFVLILNFFGWGLYFCGRQSVGVMMAFIVLMPPLYYVFVGLWRENWSLLFTGVLFGITHFCHVYGNLKI